MARALLIAEKASLMNDIQKAYRKMSGFPDQIDFKHFQGHLLKLKEPGDYKSEWEKWNLDELPMIPDKFQYKTSQTTYKLFKDIKDAVNSGNYDYLINACDCDREGEQIFKSFYHFIGCKLPVKRFWHHDTTDVEVKRALNNLLDDLTDPHLLGMSEASRLRAEFDWGIGMNITRAFSIKGGEKANIGRVMTPTLKIVVDRELEIRNFISKNYWEIEGDFDIYKGIHFYDDTKNNVKNETRYFDKAKAKGIIDNLGKIGIIEDVIESREVKSAPKLHSLSEIQNEANNVYGYSLADTLAIVQSLYEKKILSYPRTDSQYITKDIATSATGGFKQMILNTVASIPSLASYANKIGNDSALLSKMVNNKNYVDDSKVSSHYAIVPTGQKVDVTKLNTKELNILQLVAKRLLAIFMPPIILNKTQIITDVDGVKFKTNGSVVVDAGYSVIYGKSFSNNLLPTVKKGQKVPVKGAELIEKSTNPPSRYSEKGLNQAMENAGKFVEDKTLKKILKDSKGIGTPATRGSIVQKLKDLNMIEVKKKTLYATDFGISIIQNLGDINLVSPAFTAEWETKLMDVENNKYSADKFHDEMIKYIRDEVEKMKKKTFKIQKNELLGVCIKCGKHQVIEGKSYYLCEGYKKDCDFIVGKTLLGAKIGKDEIKKILQGEETKELSFSKKDGKETKKWKAKLVYDKSESNLKFVTSKGFKTSDKLVCPCCKKPLKISAKYYMCSAYKESCDFILEKEFFKAKITEIDLKKLLSGKTITKTFTWKSGKSSEAKLLLENNKYKFDFNK